MNEPAKFLGEDITYWLELRQLAGKMEANELIKEIAELRSKVSFYESRIKQMNQFANLKTWEDTDERNQHNQH
jgi:ubiquinone biosynthesis protein UbiJ